MYKDVIITVDKPRLEIASTHDIYYTFICDVQAMGRADDPDLEPEQACCKV